LHFSSVAVASKDLQVEVSPIVPLLAGLQVEEGSGRESSQGKEMKWTAGAEIPLLQMKGRLLLTR
jgi:hypothetical protein